VTALIDEDDRIGDQFRPNRRQRRAMGYVRQRKIYKLVFEDPDMAGLEVRARSVPLGTLMRLIELAGLIDRGTANLNPDEAKAIRELFTGFADALVSWNLEEPVIDDETGEETGEVCPVPATVDGLYSQDMDFALHIIEAWMDAVAGVAGPLGRRSSDGEQSLAASLPMEPPSPSPTS
jgi:hypothetical protein